MAALAAHPVSVVIPTHDRADFLPRAVDSVLAQDHPAFELIVVDDGSRDATPDILAGYGSEIRVVTFPENRGVSAARNAGIAAARHDLIAFLDSDDLFAPGKLSRQAAAMITGRAMVAHTGEVWYRRGRHLNQKKKHRKEGGFIFHRCLELCAVGMSTVMVRRALFDAVGVFDEDLPCCEDYDLWLRVSARFPFLLVDEPLTIKHGGRQDQLSARYRVGMDKYRVAAICKLLRANVLDSGRRRLALAEMAKKCRVYGNGCLKHGREREGRLYLAMAREAEGAAARPEPAASRP